MINIPQDIIDSIITAVDDGDYRLLEKYALVSSSFLLPCRKRLFSRIYLRPGRGQACQRLYQFLAGNPVVQTFVRSIRISGDLGYHGSSSFFMNATSLAPLLRLPFCYLESFSIEVDNDSNWNDFSSELRDALTTVIHSPALKSLYIERVDVPIILFQGIRLKKLELRSVSPFRFDLDGKQSGLALAVSKGGATTASDMMVDQCEWRFYRRLNGHAKPIFLPFICHIRVFEIDVDPFSAYMADFNMLSFMIQTLRISLSSPPTLEHLKFKIRFRGYDKNFNFDAFFDGLRDADVWSHLDSFITHPSGSRLERVEIRLSYTFHYDSRVVDEMEVVGPILGALPLLREKGILFVEAVNR